MPKLHWSVLVWACFVLLSFNALAFIFFTAAPYIQADVFRHLEKIVLPFLSGREGLSILWSNHHPAPLLHLIQIVNLKFLGFRLDYDAYLGFFFQTLTTFILLRSIISTTTVENQNISLLAALGAILILAISLGFNSRLQYTFPLLTVYQHVYFFGIVVFITVDRCIRDESKIRYLMVALASLGFMFANADFGTIFLASITAINVLAYVIDRRPAYLRTTLVLASTWIAYRLFFIAILPDTAAPPASNSMGMVLALLGDPLGTFSRFSVGLSSGLVDIVALKATFPGAESLLVFSSIALTLFFAATFITYIRLKLFRVTLVPLALMLLAVVFSIPTMVFRFFLVDSDSWGLAAPRYVPNFKLAIIGMLWALWLILKEKASVRGNPLRWPYKAIGVISIATILYIQGVQIHAGWETVPHLRWTAENNALAIFMAGKTLENDIELPGGVTRFNKHYHSVLAYLEKNSLNVFSDKFPRSSLLDQHVESRRLFYASVGPTIIAKESGEFGKIQADTDKSYATWEMLPQSIVIDSNASKSLYIRVEVYAESSNSLENSLVAEFGNKAARKIVLYKGRQNLFFDLDGGSRLSIKLPPPSKIETIELRM